MFESLSRVDSGALMAAYMAIYHREALVQLSVYQS